MYESDLKFRESVSTILVLKMKLSTQISLRRTSLPFTLILLIGIAIAPCLVEALFEDQAFKFDWRQQYVGKPRKSILWHDSTSTRSDLIITTTQSNVLAGIHADNGKIK